MGGVGTHVVGGSWVCVGGWVHCSVGYGRCEFLHGRLLCGKVGVDVHVQSIARPETRKIERKLTLWMGGIS